MGEDAEGGVGQETSSQPFQNLGEGFFVPCFQRGRPTLPTAKTLLLTNKELIYEQSGVGTPFLKLIYFPT